MAKRKIKRLVVRLARRLKKARKRSKQPHVEYKRIQGNGVVIKRPRISNARLERALRVLSDTQDIKAAARAIRVSPDRFKRVAKSKGAIRKRHGHWGIVGRLQKRMPIFSDGKLLAITVRSKPASLIGRYNAAVGTFLRTNDPAVLAEFSGRAVKDIHGKTYPLETNPNALYRLSSAGGEPFEDIYRIVLH